MSAARDRTPHAIAPIATLALASILELGCPKQAATPQAPPPAPGAARADASAPAPQARATPAREPSGAAVAHCTESGPSYQPRPSEHALGHSLPRGTMVERPIHTGDTFTVWGASYYLRSRVHTHDVSGKIIRVAGTIIKTNLPDAPRCAVHATGIADRENCRPVLPAFWLADDPHAAIADAIKVVGWASNFAQIYNAIAIFDGDPVNGKFVDEFWNVELPNPLPAVGAKVVVTGTYGSTFSKSSAGMEADPMMGLLDARRIDVLDPAPNLATLPGVRRSPQTR